MTSNQTIWVDADACPVVIKEILFRAADRTGMSLMLVANQALRVPPSPNIKTLQVPAGFDVAEADSDVAQILRVHDVAQTRQALDVWTRVSGLWEL